MTRALFLVGILAAAGSAWGQGYVNFINYNPSQGVNGLVIRADGVTPAGGETYGQLYASAPGGSLAPVGVPALFRNNAVTGAPTGVVSGGVVEIPGIAAGGAADIQLRAWEAARGESFEAAAVSFGAEVGFSNTISLASTGDGGVVTPAFLTGLESFTLVGAIPEPSTWALLAFGLGALALRGRRK